MSEYYLRKTDDIETIYGCFRLCFPTDEFLISEAHDMWLLWHKSDMGSHVAGFCTALHMVNAVFLSSAGVLPTHRGKRLHKRLVDVRCKFAKKLKLPAITYTVVGNYASQNTLIRAGFETYMPQNPWVGNKVNYWIKNPTVA